MTLLKMLRNPFVLIGQCFVIGGLFVIAVQDAPPAHAATPPSAAAAR
jgi:hypothetical protein